MNPLNNAGIKKEVDPPRHQQPPLKHPQPPSPLFTSQYKRRPSSSGPLDRQPLPKRANHSLSPTRAVPSSAGSTSSTYKSRPVKSCTHCRQQKIKCNAIETFPEPCRRCAKMKRKCVVDPFFRPQKGGQVALLRDDISSLRQQLAQLQQKKSTTGGNSTNTPGNTSYSPEEMSVSPQRKYFPRPFLWGVLFLKKIYIPPKAPAHFI